MDFGTQIRQVIQGAVLTGEALSRHTSFGIGGPADYLVRPDAEEELVTVLKLANDTGLPLMVIGRGTNLLVGDGGVRGVVVDLSAACRRLERVNAGVVAGSGISVAELLDFCVVESLANLEFMAGIPGSVGGAIRVNAGAWDQALGDHVNWVRGYLPSGERVRLDRSRLEFHYRRSNLPNDLIIVEAELALAPGSSEVIQGEMEAFRRRRKHQPTDQRSAGSVFKNPAGTSAGKLIEQAGCKGFRVDDAEVSRQHANFIVNRGHATAAAVTELIGKVRQRVADRFGIHLELEIICVGEE